MKLTTIEAEAIITRLETYLTGNRVKDRTTLLLEWGEYVRTIEQPDRHVKFFMRLEAMIDENLPIARRRFTKDMLAQADLWMVYLLTRANRLIERKQPKQALAILQLAESYIVPKAPTNTPNKHEFFSLHGDYERMLFKEVLYYQYPVHQTEFDYANLYYLMYWTSLEAGDDDQAIIYLGNANSWNPVSIEILLSIASFFKEKHIPDRLDMVAKFAANIAIKLPDLGDALRFVGYSFYLSGKYEKAYACYYESLRYGGKTKGTSKEINAILLAMGKNATYDLTRKQIKELFLDDPFSPEISKNALRAMKRTILENYENEDFQSVIENAEIFLMAKQDATVSKLLAKAIDHLN